MTNERNRRGTPSIAGIRSRMENGHARDRFLTLPLIGQTRYHSATLAHWVHKCMAEKHWRLTNVEAVFAWQKFSRLKLLFVNLRKVFLYYPKFCFVSYKKKSIRNVVMKYIVTSPPMDCRNEFSNSANNLPPFPPPRKNVGNTFLLKLSRRYSYLQFISCNNVYL